jgi:hypothetical protein
MDVVVTEERQYHLDTKWAFCIFNFLCGLSGSTFPSIAPPHIRHSIVLPVCIGNSNMYMSLCMEHCWNDTDRGKPKYWGKNLSQCHFVQHKCHVK